MFIPVFYKKLAPIFAFMTLGLVAPMKMLAQVDTGAISGTVKDTSGGVIPGAKVTIINEDTGLSISTTSGSAGEYVFSPVKTGHYSVSAEIKSFQRVQQNNVTVAVQQRVVVDFALPPGQTTETVVVNAEPPALQTQDASVGQVIGERTVDALPLNGRNRALLRVNRTRADWEPAAALQLTACVPRRTTTCWTALTTMSNSLTS